MNPQFQILDATHTPLGPLVLRRRSLLSLNGQDVYEVKLGEEYLMSSLFPEAEKELAYRGLAKLDGDNWDVVIGGLGLGYTAAAALENSKVQSLIVHELFPQVISWHQQGLVPLGNILSNDSRCQLIEQDFFAAAQDSKIGLDPDHNERLCHAILLDIDHTPNHQLDSENAGFYSKLGLKSLAGKLHPGGVFGLWSDDPPDSAFVDILGNVFSEIEAEVIPFYNPILDEESSNTVYLARKQEG